MVKLPKIHSAAKILIGMVAGIIIALLALHFGFEKFIVMWISPFGEIFIRLLKLIAVPLVVVSLIGGIAGVGDISRLASIGVKTVILYTISTVMAISVGVGLVSLIRPGSIISAETSERLTQGYASDQLAINLGSMSDVSQQSPLKPLVDMFADNVFTALSNNSSMLQVIVIAIIFGVAIVSVGRDKSRHFVDLIHSLNNILLKIIDMIMSIAPYCVAAIMASMVVSSAGDISLLAALATYTVTVVVALLILMYLFYPIIAATFTNISWWRFVKALLPVQLVGFTSSSSAATLATTMQCANDTLKLPPHITSFTLPIGVTINMDGTSCYQAIAVIFIAQVMNIDLSAMQILTIIATTTLSSIGTPGIPGGSIVVSMMVLSSVGIPPEGIALVMGVDRPLDMLRTSVNVTGDVAVSAIIAKSEQK